MSNTTDDRDQQPVPLDDQSEKTGTPIADARTEAEAAETKRRAAGLMLEAMNRGIESIERAHGLNVIPFEKWRRRA